MGPRNMTELVICSAAPLSVALLACVSSASPSLERRCSVSSVTANMIR